MPNIDDKVVLETKIDALQKEYRGLEDLLIERRLEIQSLDKLKQRSEDLVTQQKDILTTVMNQIAEEKLDWAQEKDRELQAIDAKKSEVEKILARTAALDSREASLNKQEEEIQGKLNESNRVLLETQYQGTANTTILTEAQNTRNEAVKISEETKKRIQDFKNAFTAVADKYKQDVNTL